MINCSLLLETPPQSSSLSIPSLRFSQTPSNKRLSRSNTEKKLPKLEDEKEGKRVSRTQSFINKKKTEQKDPDADTKRIKDELKSKESTLDKILYLDALPLDQKEVVQKAISNKKTLSIFVGKDEKLEKYLKCFDNLVTHEQAIKQQYTDVSLTEQKAWEIIHLPEAHLFDINRCGPEIQDAFQKIYNKSIEMYAKAAFKKIENLSIEEQLLLKISLFKDFSGTSTIIAKGHKLLESRLKTINKQPFDFSLIYEHKDILVSILASRGTDDDTWEQSLNIHQQDVLKCIQTLMSLLTHDKDNIIEALSGQNISIAAILEGIACSLNNTPAQETKDTPDESSSSIPEKATKPSTETRKRRRQAIHMDKKTAEALAENTVFTQAKNRKSTRLKRTLSFMNKRKSLGGALKSVKQAVIKKETSKENIDTNPTPELSPPQSPRNDEKPKPPPITLSEFTQDIEPLPINIFSSELEDEIEKIFEDLHRRF